MLFVCTKEGLIIPVLLSHQVYSSLQDRYAGNRRYICVKKLADLVRRFSISARKIRKRNQYNPIALLIHLTVQGQAGFEWDFLAGICGGTWKAQLCQEGFPLPVRKPPDFSPPQEPPCTHCTESKYRTLWGNTSSWNPPPSRSSLAYSGGSTAL